MEINISQILTFLKVMASEYLGFTVKPVHKASKLQDGDALKNNGIGAVQRLDKDITINVNQS